MNVDQEFRFPWLTVAVTVLAAGAWVLPGAFEALAYERSLILCGELWRVATGHLVHFSASHLVWNVLVLLPAGIWLERRNRPALVRTLAGAPLAISLGLLAFNPSVAVYAGISGVATGVLVALAVDRLRADRPNRRWWTAVLLFVVVKIAADAWVGAPLNPDLSTRGITSAPLAHLLGGLTGAMAAAWGRRK